MKTSGLRFGTRFFTPIFAISIALLLIIPSSRPSAETPQGIGGTVAKPRSTKSPTTKKASSRSTSTVVSLERTVWVYSRGTGTVSLEFGADGTVSFSETSGFSGKTSGSSYYGYGGKWTQSGKQIVITWYMKMGVDRATLAGNQMSGTRTFKDENGQTRTYKWSAKRRGW
jgi:hypothetical protein